MADPQFRVAGLRSPGRRAPARVGTGTRGRMPRATAADGAPQGVQQQRVGSGNLEAGACAGVPAMARARQRQPLGFCVAHPRPWRGGGRPSSSFNGRLQPAGEANKALRSSAIALVWQSLGEASPGNPEPRTGDRQLVQEGLPAGRCSSSGRWRNAARWCSDEINVALNNWGYLELDQGLEAWDGALSSPMCALTGRGAAAGPAGERADRVTESGWAPPHSREGIQSAGRISSS